MQNKHRICIDIVNLAWVLALMPTIFLLKEIDNTSIVLGYMR